MRTRHKGKPQPLRPRYRFTKTDCQKGYQAALQKCMDDWQLAHWFFKRIRTHYRKGD